MKHTPGPWEVRQHDGVTFFAHPKGFLFDESDNPEQDLIDGKLAAAAPELLEALQDMYKLSAKLQSCLNTPTPSGICKIFVDTMMDARTLIDKFNPQFKINLNEK